MSLIPPTGSVCTRGVCDAVDKSQGRGCCPGLPVGKLPLSNTYCNIMSATKACQSLYCLLKIIPSPTYAVLTNRGLIFRYISNWYIWRHCATKLMIFTGLKVFPYRGNVSDLHDMIQNPPCYDEPAVA